MNAPSPNYQVAENFRKNKQYDQAVPLFGELWASEPTAFIGWRYALCLRETKQLEAAEQVARKALELFPNDSFTLKQLAWILQDQERYEEAATLFGGLWAHVPDIYIARSYAFCLRRLGRLDEAEQISRQGLEIDPDNGYLNNELIWVLYEKKLKPAKEESDLGQILQAAEEILVHNPSGLALEKTVLAVMKVAKGQSSAKWNVVLEWADKASAQSFTTTPNQYAGKPIMSDREVYYVGRSRALFELKRYEEALQQAQEGQRDFPNSFFLQRTEARAKAGMGDLEGATKQLEQLLKHSRAEWYAKAELAEYKYRMGNPQEAYRLMCDALQSTRQASQYKLSYLVTMANIALALNKPEVAAAHVQFAKVVRANHEWGTPGELVQAERATLTLLESLGNVWPPLPDDEEKLSRTCQEYWRDGATEGFARKQGTILPARPDKKFTFIRPDDGSENVIVQQWNLPRNWKEGMKVDFALKPSYDKKKERDSFEAMDVRLLK